MADLPDFGQLDGIMSTALTGSVVRTDGMAVSVAGFPAPVGSVVEIERQAGPPVEAEVIGFRDENTIAYPLGDLAGVRFGNRARLVRTSRSVRVGEALLGRVVNARGEPIDGGPRPDAWTPVPLFRAPPPAISRPRITDPLPTGVRAIDGLLTCGRGQRIGVFSGAGVGKSVMLGMMARYTAADVTVIALVGERGREVNEFLERDLGPAGLRRSVVVVATSDERALVRVQAAFAATAVAEYFRDQGRDVLLIMDSLTRFALAQREIGLAAGEPPATRGYPPSVFGLLPRLVERAGRSERGSITAFYSVLVEGDDTNEPVSDAVRGLLDGHTILSRKIAARAHYPAIDVLESISRLMTEVCGEAHLQAAQAVREVLSAYRDHEDLISIGAYRSGSNPAVDAALRMKDAIDAFLRQPMNKEAPFTETLRDLTQLGQQVRSARAPRPAPPAPPARN
ncbi:MAG: FliI/YscN family ATPase [Planctomycetes bacterium]|nr:FliI/YscN family ATPase [Planctomycetota bacterium]